MYKLNNILVSLDLSDIDSTLIRFASQVAKVSKTQKIFFVMIVKDLDLPAELKKEFPDLIEKALAERTAKISDSVEKYLDKEVTAEIKIEVVKGSGPAKKILSICTKENIDLAIVGKKDTEKGSGVVSQRLARKADCSLLIVPEGAEPKFENVLVPIDFSDNAEIALEEAISIAKNRETPSKIYCQNVYTVPAGFHYSGKTYEEFAELMRQNAKKNFKKFLKKVDTKGLEITPIYSQDINENKISDIEDAATSLKADCIIIGLKGQTTTSALILGNLAERMVSTVAANFPLLVVRPKGSKSGLMDYFKEL